MINELVAGINDKWDTSTLEEVDESDDNALIIHFDDSKENICTV